MNEIIKLGRIIVRWRCRWSAWTLRLAKDSGWCPRSQYGQPRSSPNASPLIDLLLPFILVVADHSVIFVHKVCFGVLSEVVSGFAQVDVHVVGQPLSANWKVLDKKICTLTSGASITCRLKWYMFSGVTSQKGRRPTPSKRAIGSDRLSVMTCR